MVPDEIARIAQSDHPLSPGERGGEKGFEVWPENADAVGLFMACQTQWRQDAAGGPTGLDYAALEAVMRMHKVKDKRAMLGDIRAMEYAALEALNGGD